MTYEKIKYIYKKVLKLFFWILFLGLMSFHNNSFSSEQIINSLKDGNKLIFITENSDNALLDIANRCNAEIIEHKKFVGGRYSVLSEVGMLPAFLMGLEIKKFKNFEKLIKNKKFISCLIHDAASIYTLNNKSIKKSVFISYDSKLYDLSYWYQQLVGESLGKLNKGITPIISIGPKDNHSLLQLYLDGPKDKFFTFFNSTNVITNYKLYEKNFPKDLGYLKNKTLKLLVLRLIINL